MKYQPEIQETIQALADNSLVSLDFGDLEFSLEQENDLFTGLQTNTSLRSLSLGEGQISSEDNAVILSTFIANNTSLAYLLLYKNYFTMNEFFSALLTNTTLKTLELSNLRLCDKEFTILFNSLEKNVGLTALDLSFNYCREEGFKSLSKALSTNTSLNYLSLFSNKLNRKIFQDSGFNLVKNKTLTHLDLQHNDLDAKAIETLITYLSENAAVSYLNLSNNPLGRSIATELLSNFLKSDKTLRTLKLDSIGLTRTGSLFLAEALEENSTLTHLEISHNDIHKNFLSSLSKNTALQYIDLSATSIKKVFATLTDSLRKEPSLTHLDISNNYLERTQISNLTDVLKYAMKLTNIILMNNVIGDTGIKYIADCLKSSKVITHLNLAGNSIGLEGIKYFTNAIKFNNTLTKLDLRNNKFSDEGALSIAELLSVNKSLNYLNLWFSGIRAMGTKAICKALADNQTLHQITLNYYSDYTDSTDQYNLNNSQVIFFNGTFLKSKLDKIETLINTYAKYHCKSRQEQLESVKELKDIPKGHIRLVLKANYQGIDADEFIEGIQKILKSENSDFFNPNLSEHSAADFTTFDVPAIGHGDN